MGENFDFDNFFFCGINPGGGGGNGGVNPGGGGGNGGLNPGGGGTDISESKILFELSSNSNFLSLSD